MNNEYIMINLLDTKKSVLVEIKDMQDIVVQTQAQVPEINENGEIELKLKNVYVVVFKDGSYKRAFVEKEAIDKFKEEQKNGHKAKDRDA